MIVGQVTELDAKYRTIVSALGLDLRVEVEWTGADGETHAVARVIPLRIEDPRSGLQAPMSATELVLALDGAVWELVQTAELAEELPSP
jgi:hypothetical protein